MGELFFCLHRAGIIDYVWREERSQVATEELLNICVWLLLKCSPEIRANCNTTGPTAASWANVPPTLAGGLHNNSSLKPSSSKHLASLIFLWMHFKVSFSPPLKVHWAAFPSAHFCKKMKVTHQLSIHLFPCDMSYSCWTQWSPQQWGSLTAQMQAWHKWGDWKIKLCQTYASLGTAAQTCISRHRISNI